MTVSIVLSCELAKAKSLCSTYDGEVNLLADSCVLLKHISLLALALFQVFQQETLKQRPRLMWPAVLHQLVFHVSGTRELPYLQFVFLLCGVADWMLAHCLPHSSLIVTLTEHRHHWLIHWWLIDWLIDWLTAGCQSPDFKTWADFFLSSASCSQRRWKYWSHIDQFVLKCQTMISIDLTWFHHQLIDRLVFKADSRQHHNYIFNPVNLRAQINNLSNRVLIQTEASCDNPSITAVRVHDGTQTMSADDGEQNRKQIVSYFTPSEIIRYLMPEAE